MIRGKKKSTFISQDTVPDDHFVDTFGAGVNRKVPWLKFLDQIKEVLVGPSVLQVQSITELATIKRTPNQQYSRAEFWPGTGVGGVKLVWEAARDVSEHNGGTIIDPAKISELDTGAKTFGTYFTADTVSGNTGCFVVEVRGDLDSRIFGDYDGVDTGSVVRAMISAASDGDSLSVFYRDSPAVASNLVVDNKAITLDFNGNTINLESDSDRFLQFDGQYTDTQSVSALALDSEGRTVLTVSDASAYSSGKVVKVYSEDLQPDEWVNDRRLGEHAVVDSVSGSDVTLDHQLFDHSTYATNVTVAIQDEKRFKVKNAVIDGQGTSSSPDLIQINRAYRPLADNISVVNHGNSFFVPVSCYKYRAVNCSAEFLPSPSPLGYGVNDAGSYYGKIINFSAISCRHAFTNNSIGSVGLDSRSGRTVGTRVNGVSVDSKDVHWDTHPGAAYVTFDGCEVVGGESYAFQSRSFYTTILNPKGRGSKGGFLFGGARGGTNPLLGQKVINPDMVCSASVISVYASSGHPFDVPAEIELLGGSVTDTDTTVRGAILNTAAPHKITIDSDIVIESQGTDTLGYMTNPGASGEVVTLSGTIRINDSTSGHSLLKSGATYSSAIYSVVHDLTVLGDPTNPTVYVSDNLDLLPKNINIENVDAGFAAVTPSASVKTWGAEL